MGTKRKTKPALPKQDRPKRPPGRPPLLTAAQFRAGANGYFAFCAARMKCIEDDEGNPKSIPWPEIPTKEGLTRFVSKAAGKYISAQDVMNWASEERTHDPELFIAVKEAHDEIKSAVMRHVLDSKTPTGGIFYAKAALGYRDVQEIEVGGKGANGAIEWVVRYGDNRKPQEANEPTAQNGKG